MQSNAFFSNFLPILATNPVEYDIPLAYRFFESNLPIYKLYIFLLKLLLLPVDEQHQQEVINLNWVNNTSLSLF